MKEILKKTRLMKTIEQKHGIPINELIRKLYVDDNLSINQILQTLKISYATLFKWLKQAGVYSRRLKL